MIKDDIGKIGDDVGVFVCGEFDVSDGRRCGIGVDVDCRWLQVIVR